MQSPENTDSEFFAAKLAKIKSEREQIDLQHQLIRKERIPIADALEIDRLLFASIRGIIIASKLPAASVNKIFDAMRAASQELRMLCNMEPDSDQAAAA